MRFRVFPSFLALPVVLLLAPLGGCAHTFDATTLGAPVTMATAAGEAVEGNRFQVTSRAVFAFWGVLKIKEPSLRKALAAQLAGGQGIAELRIKVRSRWSDVLVTALTGGLIVPRVVTFEGVVLK
ncbi:MAG TPA: hypothetical protein VFH26_07515 [Gemmatimonadales bacterium]|nr:hypothetical protein [Gemmatimonadales bacterium]